MRPSVFLLLIALTGCANDRAKNIILFLADAGGTSTIHAASVHGYGDTRKLYIQSMPHIGLMDTSTASQWVSDSAAGMTAIVTGRKTHNGVISQDDTAVRGKTDGAPLKTILEYAEEQGLATGIITNRPVHDATPAACYAQANDRRATATILRGFRDLRCCDGVDILIGAGRKTALEATTGEGIDFLAELARKHYGVFDSWAAAGAGAARMVVLMDSGDFELAPVLERTVELLSANPKGYFLMVEWDAHTSQKNPAPGLDNLVEFDRAIRQISGQVNKNETLLLFTADHSFDIRMVTGRRGEPLVKPAVEGEATEGKPALVIDGSHSGEEVLITAEGPGADKVRGYLDNTDAFRIMMAAYGWTPRD
jgi:alkaline phosphatase